MKTILKKIGLLISMPLWFIGITLKTVMSPLAVFFSYLPVGMIFFFYPEENPSSSRSNEGSFPLTVILVLLGMFPALIIVASLMSMVACVMLAELGEALRGLTWVHKQIMPVRKSLGECTQLEPKRKAFELDPRKILALTERYSRFTRETTIDAGKENTRSTLEEIFQDSTPALRS